VRDLLPEISLKEISGHTFWNEPTISPSSIFVTANFVWGPSESHVDKHRYIISAYVIDDESSGYYLEDRYMTVLTYDGEFGFEKTDVLVAERNEILTRLRRARAERERRQQAPR
jgi:hypothetical protein